MADEVDVFLSYSAADSRYASELVRALELRGVRTWTDRDVEGGADLRRESERALRAARSYVLIVSDRSAEAPNLNFELGAALVRGSPLIPVFLSKRARDRTPTMLTEREGVDAEGLPVAEVADRIADLLGAASAHS